MGKSIRRFLGFWMAIGGVLIVSYWFVTSSMAEEEVNMLLGAAYVFIGLILAVFGWHMWRSNIEARKKDAGWTCDECGNKISEKDKFCAKCGTEFE